MSRIWIARLAALSVAAAAFGCEGGVLLPEGGAVETVEISPESPGVEVGGSLQLTATLRDDDGNALSGREVFWSTEDPAVARVSPGGMVTGEALGTVRIAASSEGKSALATLVVGPPTVASVAVAPPKARIPVRATIQLQATPLDRSGRPLAGRPVAWSSSDPSVVEVDASGGVTALRPGTAEVAATSEGQAGRSEITVIAGSPTRVVAAGGEGQTGAAGTTLPAPLAVRVTDSDGNAIAGVQVAWTVRSGGGTVRATLSPTDAEGISTAEWTLGPAAGPQSAAAEVSGLPAVVFGATAGPGTIATIAVAPDGATLTAIGETRQLTAIARDAAGNVVPVGAFSWSSSAPSVAGVSPSGLAVAAGNGTATIAAEAGGVRGTAALHVAQQVARIALDAGSVTLVVGASARVTATPVDANGSAVPGVAVAWSSSADAVATVDASGTVTGRSPGTATLTASAAGRSAQVQVAVVAGSPPPPEPVATVTVTPPTGEVQVGGAVQLTATLRDAAGNVLTGRTVQWSSSADGVATVDAAGLVTGVSPGTATITATSEGRTGTATVTVTALPPAPVATVTVSPPTGELDVGATLQLTATLRDAAGNVLTGRAVQWSSGAPLVATVDATGRVTALAPGTATVTATSEGQTGTATITVRTPVPAPVASVTVSPPSGEVQAGGTLQLTATLRDAAGNVLTGRTVQWSSSADGVATVDATGLVTGVAPGTATITATSEGQSGTATVTVTPPPPAPVASVTVSPPTGELDVGGTLQLTATLQDAAGNVLTGRTVQWSSSADGVATVDAAGMVTAVGPGTATITATSEGQSGTATVTVTAPPPAPVATVTVTPAEATVREGATVQLTATVRDAAGNVLTGRTVVWTSSNPDRARVDQNGLVTGVKAGGGRFTITAEVEGVSGTATVRVEG